MGGTGVTLELLEHGVAERPLGQHPLDRMFEHAAWKALLHFAECRGPDTARVTAVAMIELVFHFVAGHLDLLDVGHDDKVTGVDVRGIDRLVFAAQTMRDRAREPPEHPVAGVDHVPIPLYVLRLGGIGFHPKLRESPGSAG